MDIENIELIPGKDITLSSKRWGLTLYVFWHSPSFNTGWYPFVQVDDDTVIRRSLQPYFYPVYEALWHRRRGDAD